MQYRQEIIYRKENTRSRGKYKLHIILLYYYTLLMNLNHFIECKRRLPTQNKNECYEV